MARSRGTPHRPRAQRTPGTERGVRDPRHPKPLEPINPALAGERRDVRPGSLPATFVSAVLPHGITSTSRSAGRAGFELVLLRIALELAPGGLLGNGLPRLDDPNTSAVLAAVAELADGRYLKPDWADL